MSSQQQAAQTRMPAPKQQQQHLPPFSPCSSHSIQAKGVPLPEVDEQLLPLQQQVSIRRTTACRHHNTTHSSICIHTGSSLPGRVHGGGRFPPCWFSAPDTQHSRLPCRHSTLIINTLTAPSPAQVEAVMQSVASHRASVPAVISKALEQQLHAMRPDGCAVGAAAAGDDAVAPTCEGRHRSTVCF